MKLTLKHKILDDGRIFGQIVEIPEVLSEASNMEDLKENITEALEMYFEYKREEQEEDETAQCEEFELV